MTFSPDQRYLAGISFDNKNLSVWDVHEVDRQLTNLGVALEWASARAAPPDYHELTPLKIVSRVESRSEALERQLAEVTQQLRDGPQDQALHYRRGWLLDALERPREAIDELTQAIDLAADPAIYGFRARAYAAAGDDASAIRDAATALGTLSPEDPRQGGFCNGLAWCYVMSPPALRQPEQALELVRRALRLEPGRAAYLNTLGVAFCRHEDWDDSVDALRRSLRAGSQAPACDWYILAQCYHRLHNARQATEAFEQAVYWHDLHEPGLDGQTRRELAKMRFEIEALLGLASPKTETSPPAESDDREDASTRQGATP
jgi:tetratricopeptide (TPR) repeat protein